MPTACSLDARVGSSFFQTRPDQTRLFTVLLQDSACAAAQHMKMDTDIVRHVHLSTKAERTSTHTLCPACHPRRFQPDTCPPVRLSAWAVFPVAEVAILGFTRVSYPGMGNLEEGKLASAQQNVEMPRRCFWHRQHPSCRTRRGPGSRSRPGSGPSPRPGPAQDGARQRQRQLECDYQQIQDAVRSATTKAEAPHSQHLPDGTCGRTATIITHTYRSSSTSDAWAIRSNLPNPGCCFSNAS